MQTGIIQIYIMLFLDRKEELARLMHVWGQRLPALVVVYGRRRIGKTRLLRPWMRKG
jgi:uncharacterized protein